MNAHLTAAEIVTLRDGEALPAGRSRHAEGCTVCAEALQKARFRARRVEAALPPGPDAEAVERAREAVRARLGAGNGRAASSPALGRRTRWGLGSLSRAAGLLLLLAGGAAALPGSPVRSWVESALEAPEPVAETAAPGETPPAAAAAPPETGIRLRVERGPVEVQVTGLPAGARIEVTRGDGNELEVVAPDGSRFSSSDGLVRVTADNGPVRVTLPATVVPATVRAGDRILLRWTDRGREILAPVTATQGERLVFEVVR